MRIEYTQTQLKNVLDDYAKGFVPKDGSKVSNWDWYLDPVQGVVIFRLYLIKAVQSAEPTDVTPTKGDK